MSRKLNRCYWNATSAGTVDFVYASTVTGFLSPIDATGDSYFGSYDQYFYIAENGTSEWEIGTGRYNAGTHTLERTWVFSSTNANAKVNFSAPPKVRMGAPTSEDFGQPVLVTTGATTITLPEADLVYLISGGTAGVETFQLPVNYNDTTLGKKMTVFFHQRGAVGDKPTSTGVDGEVQFTGLNDWAEFYWDPWYYGWRLLNSNGRAQFSQTPKVWYIDSTGNAYWTNSTDIFNGTATNAYWELKGDASGNIGWLAPDISMSQGWSEVITGASPVNVVDLYYNIRFTSGGTGGNETVKILTSQKTGTRQLYSFNNQVNPLDRIVFDITNSGIYNAGGTTQPTSITLSAGNELLLEQWGNKRVIVFCSGVVV